MVIGRVKHKTALDLDRSAKANGRGLDIIRVFQLQLIEQIDEADIVGRTIDDQPACARTTVREHEDHGAFEPRIPDIGHRDQQPS